MAKKIIILNGSPRRNGNTTALTAHFKKGAEESGRRRIRSDTRFSPALLFGGMLVAIFVINGRIAGNIR